MPSYVQKKEENHSACTHYCTERIIRKNKLLHIIFLTLTYTHTQKNDQIEQEKLMLAHDFLLYPFMKSHVHNRNTSFNKYIGT